MIDYKLFYSNSFAMIYNLKLMWLPTVYDNFKGKSVTLKQKMRKRKMYAKEMLVNKVSAETQQYNIPHTALQDYKWIYKVPHPNSALTPTEEEPLISFIFGWQTMASQLQDP